MEGVRWNRVLRTAAIAMVVSAALAIVGEVVLAFSFRGVRTSDRLDLISQIATPAIGVLLVGAAILLITSRRDSEPDESPETEWLSVAVITLGSVIAVAALYSVVRIVSVHVPSPGASGQGLRVGLSTGDWSGRLGQILLRLAGGVLGAWAAVTSYTTRVGAQPVGPGPSV